MEILNLASVPCGELSTFVGSLLDAIFVVIYSKRSLEKLTLETVHTHIGIINLSG